MKTGEVAGPLRTSRGFVFETLVAKQDPYVPKLDEVKDRVRDEVVKQKARDVEQAEGGRGRGEAEVGARLREGGQGGRRRSEDDRPDHARLADPGPRRRARRSRTRRSSCRRARVSDPIPTDNGTAVIKVLEKKEVTPTRTGPSNKDKFRDELLTDRRNRFFSAYMVKAKQKMKIDVNREALQRVVELIHEHHDAKTRRHERTLDVHFVHVVPCGHRHRKNVNGISASGSPRRNIANGPRIDAQRFDLPGRQVRAQPRADCAIDSPAPLNCSDTSS